MQFADDAAIIADKLTDAQLRLDLFHRWTSWADLSIRPDKCFAYAAAHKNEKYQQIKPSLSVNNINIPTIEYGSSMTYLGHNFHFKEALTSATKNKDLPPLCYSSLHIIDCKIS